MLYHQSKGGNTQQIIFIHGNSQSLEIWDDVIKGKQLENNYTLITVDLPGHGKSFVSKDANKDYGIQGMAEHLKGFLLQYNTNEYIIVANSAATNLVGEIAHLLVNCKGIFLTGASIIGENINPSEVLKPNPNLTPFFTPNPTDEDIDKMIEDGACNISIENKIRYRDIFKETDPAFREYWLASISKREWTDEIENLNLAGMPIAVVYGEKDNFTFTGYLDGLLSKKWKNEIILVPDAGHLLQFDQPQLLFQLIKEFAKDCFN